MGVSEGVRSLWGYGRGILVTGQRSVVPVAESYTVKGRCVVREGRRSAGDGLGRVNGYLQDGEGPACTVVPSLGFLKTVSLDGLLI